MKSHNARTLLAGVPADRYVGRLDQIDRLYLHAVSTAAAFGLRLSTPPSAGASELLKQVYDRLFREQRFVVPFYFALRPGDGSGHSAAARYVYEFLVQTIAFRSKDPALLSTSPDICELSKLAPVADADWVARLCEVCEKEGPLNDERAFIRSAFAAPLRAAVRAKMQICVMLDDLHESTAIDGGRFFIDELSAVFSKAPLSFILAARRGFAVSGLHLDNVELGFLSHKDAATLVEVLAADLDVSITEQVRDLVAVQFGGNPVLIRAMIRAARERRISLNSYRDMEQLYSTELLSGRIGHYFDHMVERSAPEPGLRRTLIEGLYSVLTSKLERFSLDTLCERLGIPANEFRSLIGSLDLDEVIRVESGSARLSRNEVLRDFLDTRFRLLQNHTSATAVSASTVTEALKRAPRLMAHVYRHEAAAGLQDLIQLFDLQDIPLGLIDYRVFRNRYKGISDEEARTQLAAETSTFRVPQILHTAPIGDHYSPFSEFIEPSRTAVGVGFSDRAYLDEDEVVWIAVEIDSKLEADRTLAAEWCERIDTAANACGFSNYRIWLVAPEGFSDGALDLLGERQAIGTSRRQVDLLRTFLSRDPEDKSSVVAEYELVIPVGEDTELIAANSLEEIARRYTFPAKAVNQIKTALVEACINAAEHGLAPDRRIYQKFAADREKIVITVSNRGLRLTSKNSARTQPEPSEGRRGWGLNLIRGLMDDVRIEHLDDGTRIVMTKYLVSSKTAP